MGSGGVPETMGSVTPGIEGISGGRLMPCRLSAWAGEAAARAANRTAMRLGLFMVRRFQEGLSGGLSITRG